MAPRAWQAKGDACILLAGAIIGATGKSPAGVCFGHLPKMGESCGTQGLSVLKPSLRKGRTDNEVDMLTNGKWTSISALQRVRLGSIGEAKKVEELCKLGLPTVRRHAHPRAVALICG